MDFSAIAKGFAVDRMADALDEESCSAYLIELGGEARAFGRAPDGGPWRVGVESPGDGWKSPIVLRIEDGAVATAGDYRQFREPTAAERALLPTGQERISHIVDPRYGLPVGHALASVTVVAEEAMFDEGPNLLHCAQALGLKCHDHPPSVEDSAPLHAHVALDSALPFMLT